MLLATHARGAACVKNPKQVCYRPCWSFHAVPVSVIGLSGRCFGGEGGKKRVAPGTTSSFTSHVSGMPNLRIKHTRRDSSVVCRTKGDTGERGRAKGVSKGAGRHCCSVSLDGNYGAFSRVRLDHENMRLNMRLHNGFYQRRKVLPHGSIGICRADKECRTCVDSPGNEVIQ